MCSGTSDFGDLDEVFAQSDIVFERTYTSQATQTAPMETFRAFAMTDAFGRISVTTSTQVPFHVRRMIAQSLDIPQSQVQVIKPRIGGGFGSKQTGCCEIFVAFVTQQTGRPSYCCYTREETITAGNSRHQMQMAVKLEGGCHHTAAMHSRNIENMNQMANAIDTSIFVKNGPCIAGLGLGGEGWTTMTIKIGRAHV